MFHSKFQKVKIAFLHNSIHSQHIDIWVLYTTYILYDWIKGSIKLCSYNKSIFANLLLLCCFSSMENSILEYVNNKETIVIWSGFTSRHSLRHVATSQISAHWSVCLTFPFQSPSSYLLMVFIRLGLTILFIYIVHHLWGPSFNLILPEWLSCFPFSAGPAFIIACMQYKLWYSSVVTQNTICYWQAVVFIIT